MKRRFMSLFGMVVILASCAAMTTNTIPVTGKEPAPVLQTTAQSLFLPVVSANLSGPYTPPSGGAGWPTVAGNNERTSWTAEAVTGQLQIEWYRPIEAYIPQNVQLIASDGLIFVSTARGLIALHAGNGSVYWRFDTELPLGNSPTVSSGVVYVGGYDRKLHALDVNSGQELWAYSGAKAGYSANPLVVDGKVIIGNRDGAMYAIGAAGTAQAGQLLWKYQTGGLIDLSAAYKDGVVYFAANDNYAYALNAANGDLVWRSNKLPGDGYQSYWPVVYQNVVIFSAASGYRTGFDPGTGSITDSSGNAMGKIFDIERADLFGSAAQGALIGPAVSSVPWSNGKPVLSAANLLNYTEEHPDRQALVVLNRNNGSLFTFDSDQDGRPETIPALFWGTHSGNRFPPVIGADGTIYFSNILSNASIPQGRVMGWRLGEPYLTQVGGQGAVDEPQALSIGGDTIYRIICCDRVGDWFSTTSNRSGQAWSYNTVLSNLAPGYDQMWYGVTPGDSTRLRGNYGTVNGVYNEHGDQNPFIPYEGRIYVHRSNAIIALGPNQGPGRLDLVPIQNGQSGTTLNDNDLRSRLESEVTKIMDAGNLRPGYYNNGQYGNYSEFADYFDNPGDTLYTLSIAYPYLSSGLQTRVRDYLTGYFDTYFDNEMISSIGWKDGAAREAMPLPSEVQASLASHPASAAYNPRWTWSYPPFNLYAMWKYTQIVTGDRSTAYTLASQKISSLLSSSAGLTTDQIAQEPFELNAYIAGYIGFTQLYAAAGANNPTLLSQVNTELNRLQSLRASQFEKDTYWTADNRYHLRTMNLSRNFIFMTPELGTYLNNSIRSEVAAAISEYNDTGPYWFVTRYNAAVNEGGRQNLYDSPALFQAKAMILKESRAQLTPYLDVPAFERGDLFYLQNLVAALNASP